jgi:hypothetical protein
MSLLPFSSHTRFLVFSPSRHLLQCDLSIVGSEKPDQSGRTSAHTGSAILPGTRDDPAVATSLIDPFYPDGRGTVSISLNADRARTLEKEFGAFTSQREECA